MSLATLSGGRLVERPRHRDLDPGELEAFVRRLAARPDLWAHLVAHDPERRIYEELLRDDHLAVWLVCWMDEHDTGYHDHDLSAGAVAVTAGTLCEERLALGAAGGDRITRMVSAGGSFTFTAADIHRVNHAGDGPAVSLHAYSPPLSRMGTYEVGEGGALRRHAVSYEEELRPLSASA